LLVGVLCNLSFAFHKELPLQFAAAIIVDYFEILISSVCCFPTETAVEIIESVRGRDVYIIQTGTK